jgi:hypothetical protein
VSWKRRSKEEIEKILKDCATGMSMLEICERHDLGERQLYRILRQHRGLNADAARRDRVQKKVSKLERKVKEQEEEIKLLRAALKKY